MMLELNFKNNNKKNGYYNKWLKNNKSKLKKEYVNNNMPHKSLNLTE